ncbi:MAG: hypothetical protein VYB86_01510 [Candidatus Thermoplasmatota archaeon]|nr:hypothetical protein [Candidatus Thermoplasmatota archaeon]
MADKPPPPPPKKAPPPPKKAPPPPPKKAPPPAPKKAPPPPKKAPPPAPKKAPPPPKKAPPPGKRKKRPAPPKKGRKGKRKPKEGQPKKKGRRIKIKLRLKQSTISEEDDSYTDQVGWTVTHDEMDEFIEEPVNKEPEIVDHQCSMCGSMMRIPRPKRDRYTVICAYPECGHEDTIGM